ncbi:MAG: tRNA (5-methylaminomethyl-2-thiouridine)(34)-methyltransferase MnmD [Bacteroidota bacterium]
MDLRLVTTLDGSHTIYVGGLNEHYHSTHGAIQEARHIFINAGIRYLIDQGVSSINLLEIGFGTGLNTFLSRLETLKSSLRIHYTTIESDPLPEFFLASLNYPEILDDKASQFFKLLHQADWNIEQPLSESFTLLKINKKLQEQILPEARYNLVFFDAFGPEVQPELWNESIFRKIGKATREGGVLVTYSAKGAVRRALKSSGFVIEKLPGPPGKREITRAVKT